ncbi:hypothetical protein K435DRAFT_800447 [Dendrothele bispora CBS 962.96]|uniref:Uncharacterized protein n=1 Tax=Dendrothele bispora (strain CBS 962.96) TaxID=1314807 RepID=A0A4V4HEU4_DENBC|nr:hypothetical protein K435DRAFT_800447 [Dendrothele bispora CBS 962.96]
MPLWNRGSSKRAEDFLPDQRRTHKNDEISGMLQNLSLDEKIKFNHNIEVNNNRRRRAHLAHALDPSKEDGSPTASLITIEDNEYQTIRKSPEWWAMKANEQDEKEKELRERERREWEREQVERRQVNRENPDDVEDTSGSQPVPQASKKNSKRAAPFSEEKRTHGQAQPIVFPQYLFVTANAKIHIPLGLFTTKNLKRLCVEGNAIAPKTHRNISSNQKEYILDISKICDAFGITDSKHPTEGLSYVEFMDAATNFYNFQCERDPDGPEGKGYAEFTRKHFEFFQHQTESPELYDFWKKHEFDLRVEKEAHNFGYDEAEYMRRWQIAQRDFAIDKSTKESMALVEAPGMNSFYFQHYMREKKL